MELFNVSVKFQAPPALNVSHLEDSALVKKMSLEEDASDAKLVYKKI